MLHMHTFVVTNMDSSPEDLIRFYCKRGQMENFIKECKSGFDMSYVSSSSMIVNANRVQIHALAYNLFNWFRRLALPEPMRKDRIDTVRSDARGCCFLRGCIRRASFTKRFPTLENFVRSWNERVNCAS